MQTVIEPTVVPQIIEIPATKEEEALQKMIEMVRGGMWCRDYMATTWEVSPKHCILGMVEIVKHGG